MRSIDGKSVGFILYRKIWAFLRYMVARAYLISLQWKCLFIIELSHCIENDSLLIVLNEIPLILLILFQSILYNYR